MTGWREWLSGWRFRSSFPSFEEGETITVYATGYDADTDEGLIRVGDSLLRVEGLSPGQVDAVVTVRVTAFDRADGTGRARLEATEDL